MTVVVGVIGFVVAVGVFFALGYLRASRRARELGRLRVAYASGYAYGARDALCRAAREIRVQSDGVLGQAMEAWLRERADDPSYTRIAR